MCVEQVSPLLSAYLSNRNLRLPYMVSLVLYAAAMVAAPFALHETLAVSERRGFDLRSSNPLTVLKLFTNGTRLRALAILEAISSGCDGCALPLSLSLSLSPSVAHTLRVCVTATAKGGPRGRSSRSTASSCWAGPCR